MLVMAFFIIKPEEAHTGYFGTNDQSTLSTEQMELKITVLEPIDKF